MAVLRRHKGYFVLTALRAVPGAENQPTASRTLYSYTRSFCSPRYSPTLFSGLYALPHLHNPVILSRIRADVS